MRIYTTLDYVETRVALARNHFSVSEADARELIASMLGYAGWGDLVAILSTYIGPLSKPNCAVSALVEENRDEYQRFNLFMSGVRADIDQADLGALGLTRDLPGPLPSHPADDVLPRHWTAKRSRSSKVPRLKISTGPLPAPLEPLNALMRELHMREVNFEQGFRLLHTADESAPPGSPPEFCLALGCWPRIEDGILTHMEFYLHPAAMASPWLSDETIATLAIDFVDYLHASALWPLSLWPVSCATEGLTIQFRGQVGSSGVDRFIETVIDELDTIVELFDTEPPAFDAWSEQCGPLPVCRVDAAYEVNLSDTDSEMAEKREILDRVAGEMIHLSQVMSNAPSVLAAHLIEIGSRDMAEFAAAHTVDTPEAVAHFVTFVMGLVRGGRLVPEVGMAFVHFFVDCAVGERLRDAGNDDCEDIPDALYVEEARRLGGPPLARQYSENVEACMDMAARGNVELGILPDLSQEDD